METTEETVSGAVCGAVNLAVLASMVVRAGEAATRTGWADDVEVFWARMSVERPGAISDELAGMVDMAAFDDGACPIVLPAMVVTSSGSL